MYRWCEAIEKHKTILTKINGLKNIELIALAVHDERNVKTKIRTYGVKVNTNFRNLNALEDK